MLYKMCVVVLLLASSDGGEMQDAKCDGMLGEMLVPASSGGEMLRPVCELTQ